MIIEKSKINNRVNLCMVKTKKFKTDLIGIYIKRPLNSKEAAMNTLISRLMQRSTMSYPTTKSLNTHLEESYGMILVADVVKYGDYQILQVKLQFPNGNYLNEAIFESAIDIMKEVVLHPNIKMEKFDDDYFNQEKAHLIDEIQSRVNDKMSYSIERCIECMYEGEAYANYVYGDVEDVKCITNEMLYQHYKHIIETSKIDISVMGDIEFDHVNEVIETFGFNDYEVHPIISENHERLQVNEVKEKFNVKQGKLVLGYDTPFTHLHELYEASLLAYYILAGSPNSRLFKLLREDKGLCYYVFSKSDRFKGSMFLGAGIESENYDLVLQLIAETIADLQWSVTETEIELAKDAMIASIRSISDFPNSFINFFYTEMLEKNKEYIFSLDQMMEDFNNVTLASVQAVYQNLSLDTVYFIDGGKK